ncbi:MAG: UDP-glucose/GDP-mannose dehydrogenase family protein [Phycisphaerales bacterium]|nr:MAG: UDP-glucose/GDP-mannose dehydrogenase family protein [Phycisphaerales bacterium]
MKITIFGMGYVGVVSGACLLHDNHDIIGVDPVEAKVADLAQGRSPIQEPQVAELLAAGRRAGRLTATTNPADGLPGSDMVWVCVGTPSDPDSGINLNAVETVVGQIGRLLRTSPDRPLIVLRSTSLPGTTAERVIPLLEKESGLTVGDDIHVVFHPEFLREGCAVGDFFEPPKIVVGEATPGAGDTLVKVYESYEAPVFRLGLGEAEMVKYCDNLFHALKITFANEAGALAKAAELDARQVAAVFCADTKLNISPRYLRPGSPFGGSCLTKDLRAILRQASLKSVRVPMLERVLESNDRQITTLVQRICAHQPRSVGLVGLAFKPETDDMRESPYVKVAKALIGEGIELRIYDPTVEPQRLIGSNRKQVQAALRHLEDLLVGSIEGLSGMDVIVVNHRTVDADQVDRWLAAGSIVLDTVGIEGVDRHASGYEGLYW